MALTRAFRETIYRRAQRDAGYRKALLTEAVNAHLGGDMAAGKAALRDVINATIGFERLAAELQKPSKSLHRMLGAGGNPNMANFFAILQVLQKRVGLKLTVRAA
ncbi:MAG: DNA-binding protein [Bryobacteraceae bacterium]